MRAVRRQEQQLAACHSHKVDRQLRFVELCVVEDNDGPGPQGRQQFRSQPFVEDIRIASTGKEHRRDQPAFKIAANQTGARAFVTGSVPVYFLPDESPAVRSVGCRRKTCFINVENIALFIHGLVKLFQEAAAILFISLCLRVSRGFFYGSRPASSMP